MTTQLAAVICTLIICITLIIIALWGKDVNVKVKKDVEVDVDRDEKDDERFETDS
jgi:hypothetical protein